MNLHLLVRVRGETAVLAAWDVTSTNVTVALRTYAAGGRMIVEGRALDVSEVESIQIVRTDTVSAQFLPQTFTIARSGRADWYRAEGGTDVTSSYLGNLDSPQMSVTADRKTVFVVHGRDRVLRDGMFSFLRALQLAPLEWNQIAISTGQASPFIGDILAAGLSQAQAILVMLTGDDVAMLREPLRGPNEPAYETALTPQPRPNVLFEAGMAFGYSPSRTILVQIGTLRPFSDISGRHILRLSNDSAARHELAQRLLAAGCAVDLTGSDWHTVGDFS